MYMYIYTTRVYIYVYIHTYKTGNQRCALTISVIGSLSIQLTDMSAPWEQLLTNTLPTHIFKRKYTHTHTNTYVYTRVC